jgi:hypothetical protein
MRNSKALFAAGAALALLATPAWAHPSTSVHFHVGQVIPLLTLGAALVAAVMRRRSRSRTG